MTVGKATSVMASRHRLKRKHLSCFLSKRQTPIGHVELAYILETGLQLQKSQNPDGNWIQPSLESTQLAVQSGASSGLPAGDARWTNVSLLNAPDANAYPIVSFTYLLSYKELNEIPGMTQDKATALVQFFWYVVHDGQAWEGAFIRKTAIKRCVINATIRSITFNGQQLPTNIRWIKL